MNFFKDRALVIATMHSKEKVIAPFLKEKLGVDILIPDNFNSDSFGTFSGEVERELSPIETAIKKAEAAMLVTSTDLAIASEGSFGPHPSLFFAAGDDELMVLVDKKNNLVIGAREVSLETNFSGEEVHSISQAHQFASRVLFPSHALIIRNSKDETRYIVKGIDNYNSLDKEISFCLENFGSCYLETDMRAMFNPTRMKVIEKLTAKLIDKILSVCEKCGTPGFDVVETKDGLPCSLCGYPTASTLSLIYICKKCNHRKEKLFPNGKFHEDPMYCQRCNP